MKQKVNKNRIILLTTAAAIILAGLAVWLWPSHKTAAPSSANAGNGTNSSSGINYGPPTETEKKDSQNAKSQDLQQSSPSPNTSSGKKPVEVQLISASNSSVKANVMGIFEDGGTCTAKFTKGAEVHTFSSTGVASSNYTQCTPITVSSITGSGWTVVVSYSSSTSSGQSAPITIN